MLGSDFGLDAAGIGQSFGFDLFQRWRPEGELQHPPVLLEERIVSAQIQEPVERGLTGMDSAAGDVTDCCSYADERCRLKQQPDFETSFLDAEDYYSAPPNSTLDLEPSGLVVDAEAVLLAVRIENSQAEAPTDYCS